MGKRELARLLGEAERAGRAAAAAKVPVPMVVVERASAFDDSSPVVRRYAPVTGGVCGFAWVNMPGGTALANAAKRRYADGRWPEVRVGKGYPTGLDVWVSGYGQSMERKAAYAGAYAGVLNAAGFDRVYATSRMD